MESRRQRFLKILVRIGKKYKRMRYPVLALILAMSAVCEGVFAIEKLCRPAIWHKVTAIVMAACMITATLPVSSYAKETGSDGLSQNGIACEGHTSHDETCGYKDNIETEEETFVPEEESSVPEEETPVPEEETFVPEEETPVPEEETFVPEEETSVPKEETLVPEEETSVPESGEIFIVTEFVEPEETIRNQAVQAGTKREDLILPDTLTVFGYMAPAAADDISTADSGTSEAGERFVDGILWETDTPFDEISESGGSCLFEPVMPKGYVLAGDVSLPQITVAVEEALTAEAVIAMIDALPTVDEIYENAVGDSDPAYAGWMAGLRETAVDIEAAKAAYDALSAEEQTAVGEERAAKLLALYDLIQRLPAANLMTEGEITTLDGLNSAIANSNGTKESPEEITVGGDIMVNREITVNGKHIKLTGGHTLTRDGSFTDNLFYVTGGGTLQLDNITLEGNSLKGTLADIRAGNLVINDGAVLQNSKSSAVVVGVSNKPGAAAETSVVMNGGEIKNNQGGGIDMNVTMMTGAVKQEITLTINDGQITGNGTTGGRCGGIYAREMVENATAQVVIAGGEISSNTAKVGGGIFVDCPFAMTKGTVSDNTASERGGGIYVTENNQPGITGGTVSGNTAAGSSSAPEKGRGNNICTRSDLILGGGADVPDGIFLYGYNNTEAVLLLSGGLTKQIGIEGSYRINPKPMVNMPVAKAAGGGAISRADFEKLSLTGMDHFSLALGEDGVVRLGNKASGQPLVLYSTYGGSPVFGGIAPSQSGDGWSWDKGTKTLTLSGAQVSTSDSYALSLPGDSKIKLMEGTTSTFHKTGNYYTVFADGALEIGGKGKLVVKGEVCGISAEGPVTMTGCQVEAGGGAGGIYGYDNVTVTDSSLRVTGGIVIDNTAGKLSIQNTDAVIDGSPYAAVTVKMQQNGTLSDSIQLDGLPAGMRLQQGTDGYNYYATVADEKGDEVTLLTLGKPAPPVDNDEPARDNTSEKEEASVGGDTRHSVSAEDNGNLPKIMITPSDSPGVPTKAVSSVDANVDANGNAVADIPSDVVNEAIKRAREAAEQDGTGQNGIALQIHVVTDAEYAGSVRVNLPKDTQERLLAENVSAFILVIDRLDIHMALNLYAIQEIHRQANDDVQLSATLLTDTDGLSHEARAAAGSRPFYDLKAVYQGGAEEITDFGIGSVMIGFPCELQEGERKEGLCAVHVDGQGKVSYAADSRYDVEQKILLFTTSHFSVYGIGYRIPADVFEDIQNHWAKSAVEFATARGFMEGSSTAQFCPDAAVTKGELMAAFCRLSGSEPSETEITGMNEKLTRQEMAVVVADYVMKAGYKPMSVRADADFADCADIEEQARAAVRSMQMAGILMGKDNNLFDPEGIATRAQACAMLQRYAELVVDARSAQGFDLNDSGSIMYYENGSPVTGTHIIGGISYCFDGSGILTQTDAAVPEDRKYLIYVVKKKDTLWDIARRYHCTVADIVRLNEMLISDPDVILEGWEIRLPQK